jgi:hypothetical protein
VSEFHVLALYAKPVQNRLRSQAGRVVGTQL